MNCPICGAFNKDGEQYCVFCGTVLGNIPNTVPQQPVQQPSQTQTYQQPVQQPNQTQTYQQPVQQPNQTQTYQQPIQQPSQTQTYQQPVQRPNQTQTYYQPLQAGYQATDESQVQPMTISDYFIYLLLILLKPYTAFKNQEENFKDIKCPAILTGIIAGIMTLVTLIKTMISAVRERSFSYSTGRYETKIDFGNLAELDYISLVGKNLLIFAAIIGAVALVYFLGTMIIKKQSSYAKLLAISATSFVSYVALGMIAAPILGLVWETLGALVMLGGTIYSVIVFITLIKEEITFEDKDMAIYFHVACIIALVIVAYYGITEFISYSVLKSLRSIF